MLIHQTIIRLASLSGEDSQQIFARPCGSVGLLPLGAYMRRPDDPGGSDVTMATRFRSELRAVDEDPEDSAHLVHLQNRPHGSVLSLPRRGQSHDRAKFDPVGSVQSA